MGISKTLSVEAGCIRSVAKTLADNQISGNLLYVSDLTIDGLYGDVVQSQLKTIGSVKRELVDNSTIAYAMQIAQRTIETNISCIVGLGGGKVLDVCKYAAYISKRPILSLPTTIANDGIASPIAVLKGTDNRPMSLGCSVPTMLLLDTQIIQDCPLELIHAGIGDTISNYMALLDWELACSRGRDAMNGYAYLTSRTSLNALMKTQYTTICPDFIKLLADCIVLSGIAMDYAGSSRPVSGSEHLFSHALDYYGDHPNLHGIQVALGTVAVLKLIGRDYSKVLNYLKVFQVDVNPRRLGISEELFIHCMKNATKMRSNRYTYMNEANLEEEKLHKIYSELVEEL